jgi:hypothetical protein
MYLTSLRAAAFCSGAVDRFTVDADNLPKGKVESSGERGSAMRMLWVGLLCGMLLLMTGCTTTPPKDRVIIHCPACGTELDAVFHTNF